MDMGGPCDMVAPHLMHIKTLEEHMLKSAMALVASLSLCLMACDKQTPTKKTTTNAMKKTAKATPTVQYFAPTVDIEKQIAGAKKQMGTNLIMVKVTDKAIWVEGQAILKLDAQGNVPADKLTGLLIADLRKAVTDVAKSRATENAAIVIGVHVDNHTSGKMMSQLYYSLNQADLSPKGSSVVTIGGGGVRSILFTTRVGNEPAAMKFSSPSLAVGPPKTIKLNHKVLVTMGSKGITVGYNEGEYAEDEKFVRLPPVEGCPADGPTICNRGKKDAAPLIKAYSTAKGDARDAAAMALVQVYDFRALYNKLVDLKAKKSDLNLVMVTLQHEMPVDLFAHVASHVRFLRPDAGKDGKFAEDKTYYLKRYANSTTDKCYQGDTKACLFPFVGLNLTQ